MERIGVFCSASNEIEPIYYERVKELGEWLGVTHRTLVYGGANVGLMECIARSVKENGGKVVGVVPTLLIEKNRVSSFPDQFFYTQSLSERKDILERESDVLVALPGGIGTLDEAFHIMSSNTIGYHNKRVIFYNINGFWDPLLPMFESLHQKGFIRCSSKQLYEIVPTFAELKQLLNQ